MSEQICPRCQSPNPENINRCNQCGASFTRPIKPSCPTNPEEGDYQVGELINDRYRILELIGRGGMGTIYRVLDTVLDEVMALKVLLPYYTREKEFVDRFINEVRITRKIAHPNIVRVHDFGKMSDFMFISMEFVDGASLREILDELGPEERLPIRQSLHIINQLCIALKYAHRYTIHRDIKPDNVMVTNRNHIKLMDFGISKLKDERQEQSGNGVVGTLQYMAPEQMQNLPDVDKRADIYSLGVLLYELLTGEIPGAFPKPASQINKDVTPALDAVIRRCLAPERERRFHDVMELRESLRPIIEGIELSSSPGVSDAKESSAEKIGVAVPGSYVNVMGAFIQESQAGIPGSSPGFDNDSSFMAGSSIASSFDSESGQVVSSAPGLPPLNLDELNTASISFYETPRPVPVQRESFLETMGKYILIIIVALAGITLLYYAAGMAKAKMGGAAVSNTPDTHAIHLNRISQMLDEGSSIIAAFEEAYRSCQYRNTPDNVEMLEHMRTMLVEDIEKRLYSNPFDMEKLNAASTDIAHAGQLDADPRVRSLRDIVTKEIAQFKFVLVSMDTENMTATFRLNNPYYPVDSQTVSVGDLLQDRFVVRRIYAKTVLLEDTHPKAGRRGLVARPMERIEAE